MCRPNASPDDIIDHLEHRDRKIRQALGFLTVTTLQGNSRLCNPVSVKSSLEKAISVGITLPMLDMKCGSCQGG